MDQSMECHRLRQSSTLCPCQTGNFGLTRAERHLVRYTASFPTSALIVVVLRRISGLMAGVRRRAFCGTCSRTGAVASGAT